ncbi:hypothetical protein WJX82_005921 [Trebouxia sp. C0006]
MSRVYLATACLRGTPVSQHAGAALNGLQQLCTGAAEPSEGSNVDLQTTAPAVHSNHQQTSRQGIRKSDGIIPAVHAGRHHMKPAWLDKQQATEAVGFRAVVPIQSCHWVDAVLESQDNQTEAIMLRLFTADYIKNIPGRLTGRAVFNTHLLAKQGRLVDYNRQTGKVVLRQQLFGHDTKLIMLALPQAGTSEQEATDHLWPATLTAAVENFLNAHYHCSGQSLHIILLLLLDPVSLRIFGVAGSSSEENHEVNLVRPNKNLQRASIQAAPRSRSTAGYKSLPYQYPKHHDDYQKQGKQDQNQGRHTAAYIRGQKDELMQSVRGPQPDSALDSFYKDMAALPDYITNIPGRLTGRAVFQRHHIECSVLSCP